jgi:DnaJ-class molecular chaperone
MRGHAFRPFGGDSIAVLTGEEPRDEASCLADEVIVDFPSVARAIDRMRSAFVADERSSPVRTALHLTHRDALEGVTVPLDVPVRCTCRACGGRGETWTESCLVCRGSGTELFRHQLQVTVPAGVSDGVRFQFQVGPRHHPPTRIELQIRVA